MQKVLVKLVDFGVTRLAAACDIGCLDESFIEFPMQAINLCLLDLVPWDLRSWNNDFRDTKCVEKILGVGSTNELQNRYEISVQFEIQPNLIFASKLCSPGFDYGSTIIANGIARKNTPNDFLQHLKKKKNM